MAGLGCSSPLHKHLSSTSYVLDTESIKINHTKFLFLGGCEKIDLKWQKLDCKRKEVMSLDATRPVQKCMWLGGRDKARKKMETL